MAKLWAETTHPNQATVLPFLVWSSLRSSFGLPMYKMDDVCRRRLFSPSLSRKRFSSMGTAGFCVPCCVLVFGSRSASSTRLCHDARGVYPLSLSTIGQQSSMILDRPFIYRDDLVPWAYLSSFGRSLSPLRYVCVFAEAKTSESHG